jgi:carbamoyl-phosphate synthase large subunit
MGSPKGGDHNVLVSSGGRRVALARCFRQSLARSVAPGWVGTIDSGTNAPLSFAADRAWRAPRCADPEFIDAVLQLCIEQHVALVVPTIDPELSFYAASRERFARHGVTVAVSDPRTVAIACDKARTHAWLVSNGFPTVRQASVRNVLDAPDGWKFPLIAKPATGSASIGIRMVASLAELEPLVKEQTAYIVQEIARGREFTVNVYVDKSGSCIAAVPHWRMEVRAGEVSKGLTVKDPELVDLARRVSESLPGAYGALNIQGFSNGPGEIRLIEINARFGGGYPLAHQAGARFTDWLLDEVQGKRLATCDDWMDDLAMLRYDDAVFVPGASIRS